MRTARASSSSLDRCCSSSNKRRSSEQEAVLPGKGGLFRLDDRLTRTARGLKSKQSKEEGAVRTKRLACLLRRAWGSAILLFAAVFLVAIAAACDGAEDETPT